MFERTCLLYSSPTRCEPALPPCRPPIPADDEVLVVDDMPARPSKRKRLDDIVVVVDSQDTAAPPPRAAMGSQEIIVLEDSIKARRCSGDNWNGPSEGTDTNSHVAQRTRAAHRASRDDLCTRCRAEARQDFLPLSCRKCRLCSGCKALVRHAIEEQQQDGTSEGLLRAVCCPCGRLISCTDAVAILQGLGPLLVAAQGLAPLVLAAAESSSCPTSLSGVAYDAARLLLDIRAAAGVADPCPVPRAVAQSQTAKAVRQAAGQARGHTSQRGRQGREGTVWRSGTGYGGSQTE